MNLIKETLEISKNRDYKSARVLQLELRKKISFTSMRDKPKKIFGVDLAYKENRGFISIVFWDNEKNEVVSIFNLNRLIKFPYIPGFLSFREFPLFYELFQKISVKPDLIVFDGHGYAHMRRMGIATHAGILLGIPVIGCAKSRLTGKYIMPVNKLNAFSLLKDNDELIGYVLRSRVNVKPIFVSPGNNITFKESLDIIMNLKRKTKLPMIMQVAHNSCESYKRSIVIN